MSVYDTINDMALSTSERIALHELALGTHNFDEYLEKDTENEDLKEEVAWFLMPTHLLVSEEIEITIEEINQDSEIEDDEEENEKSLPSSPPSRKNSSTKNYSAGKASSSSSKAGKTPRK